MPGIVIVGVQWGDEGKGKATDLLGERTDWVVKFNGGNNAGHTVVIGDEKYALHLLPSGILTPGVVPVIGNGVVIDLGVLFHEIDGLDARGVDTSRLQIGTVLEMGTVFEMGAGPLRLEITTPRIPCATFADRVGRPRWVRRFTEAGRPGAYARVLTPGTVRAGDEVRVAEVPTHGVTIGRVFAGVDDDEAGRLLDAYALSDLAPSLVRKLDPATDIRPADGD